MARSTVGKLATKTAAAAKRMTVGAAKKATPTKATPVKKAEPTKEPTKKSASANKASAKKTSAKKTPAKKAPAKKAPAKTAAAASKKSAPAKKAPAKKAPAKKAPAKTAAAASKKSAPAKKTTEKKTAAKETPAKETPAKETPAKETPAKETPAKKASKKAPSKKAAADKAPAKKTAATKKSPAKKSPTAKKGDPAASLAVKADESPWTRAELDEVRTELTADAERLRGELDVAERELDDLMRDAGDGAGNDQADVGSTTFERDHEMSLANNARTMLTQTEHALERIEDGTYGRCESCGQPIGKNRLMAFPRATLCLTCKQKEERR